VIKAICEVMRPSTCAGALAALRAVTSPLALLTPRRVRGTRSLHNSALRAAETGRAAVKKRGKAQL